MDRIDWSEFVIWVADRYSTSPAAWGLRDVAEMVMSEREAEIAVRVGVTNNARGIASLKEMWLKESAAKAAR